MTDPDDPLRGLDPYPRERIDGLIQERADLLEEIVSTPGPGRTPTPARTKVLLTVGIAAALVIVGGGVWFVAGSDDPGGAHDARVAAAPTTPGASDETPPATPASPDRAAGQHRPGDRLGQVERLVPRQCRQLLAGRHGGSKALPGLARLRLPRVLSEVRSARRHGGLYYLVGLHGRTFAISGDCRIRFVRSLR